MEKRERDALVGALGAMPDQVARTAALVGEANATVRPPDGSFCFVEHVWHLVDIEGDAYAVRLERLREEADPVLADFDGARVAKERNYRERSVREGLGAFARVRGANLATLAAIQSHEWSRAGTQEQMGPVCLRDVPRMMAEHDATHRREMEDLLRWLATRSPD
jgi:hypothetical protein